MDEREAISRYDRAGDSGRGCFAGVHWPHVAIERANLERLAEGVIGARLDLARIAFGDDFDTDACADRIEEAWRTDAMQTRYAPEGVFVRVSFTVRVTLVDEEDGIEELLADETLAIEAEMCLSFVERHHTRPFVDFMGGKLRRVSDDLTKAIDPFSMEIEPADAVAWGLNDAEPTADRQ